MKSLLLIVSAWKEGTQVKIYTQNMYILRIWRYYDLMGKAFKVVTDNASNMLKAFNLSIKELVVDESSDDEVDDDCYDEGDIGDENEYDIFEQSAS